VNHPSTSSAKAIGRRHLGCPGAAVIAALGMVFLAGCGTITAQGKNAEGVRLFNQARYQDALTRFQDAANDDPRNADAYYNLASVYHRLGIANKDSSMLAQAEHYYNLCLDRDENHRECYRGLAVLLAQQNRNEEAFRLLEGWADRQPLSAEPKIELARLYEEYSDPEAAKQQLVEALAIDHQNPRALVALGHLREKTGQYEQALANYRQSLWYDRFQGEVAARAAALQTALGPASASSTPGATDAGQIAGTSGTALR
jgi:tetratricopeptide (TPR) repeat protein